MIWYSVLFLALFLLALILRLGSFGFYSLAEHSLALVDRMISAENEDEKIRQIGESTNRLMLSMLKMLLIFIIALAAGSVPIVVYCIIAENGCRNQDLFSFYPILAASIGATLAFIIPITKKDKSGYSELSRLLHRMALDNYNTSFSLFRKERKRIKRKGLERNPRFVIISGLARAGTTSLMNDLSKIGCFVSLHYGNMPFLLCPNFWKKIYKPKTKTLRERSHQDGIKIGLESNEALEEYFFKVKSGDSYINDKHLSEYSISEKDYHDYLDYQTIIRNNNSRIYLAKNNNFLLRYNSLRTFNEDFVMVILFREPLAHANSLLEKHQYYSRLQLENPFVLEYMNWLGHHEFGLNQKPFIFDNSEQATGDKNSLDYWLRIWINYYRYVLNIDHPNTLLLNYHSYCREPESTVKSVLQKTGIEAELPDYTPFINNRKSQEPYSEEVFQKALEVYIRLKEKSEKSN